MYSELYQLSNKLQSFIAVCPPFINPILKRETIGGLHVKLFIKQNGDLDYIQACRQDKKNKEEIVMARNGNKSIFPKFNFSSEYISFKNIPLKDTGKTNFSKMNFKIADKKSFIAPSKYAKDELAKDFNKPKVKTLFGDLVCGFNCISDMTLFFEKVFNELIKLSKTDPIVLDVLETFIFAKDKALWKIPFIFVYKDKNGNTSLDTKFYSDVAKIISPPKTKIVPYGNTTEEIYYSMPKFKFPYSIGEKFLFARNSIAPSLSVYGKTGTETCIIPAQKYNRVLSFLEFIMPNGEEEKSFMRVNLSRYGEGVLCVVYDDTNCKKEIMSFLGCLDENEKEGEFKTIREKVIKAIKTIRNDAGALDSPVGFLLIGVADKASAGLFSNVSFTKSHIIECLSKWEEKELPQPKQLISCFKTCFKFNTSKKVETVFLENGTPFGYEEILEFVFGNSDSLNKKVLKTLIPNLKAYVIAKNAKGVKISNQKMAENMIKFLNFILERMEKTTMTEYYKKFGRICALSDKIQSEYWNEKKIQGMFTRTIGGDAISLIHNKRPKDAYMNLMRNVQVYLNWAKAKIRMEKLDSSTWAYRELKKEIDEFKTIDLNSFFNQNTKDVEIGYSMMEYVTGI